MVKFPSRKKKDLKGSTFRSRRPGRLHFKETRTRLKLALTWIPKVVWNFPSRKLDNSQLVRMISKWTLRSKKWKMKCQKLHLIQRSCTSMPTIFASRFPTGSKTPTTQYSSIFANQKNPSKTQAKTFSERVKIKSQWGWQDCEICRWEAIRHLSSLPPPCLSWREQPRRSRKLEKELDL